MGRRRKDGERYPGGQLKRRDSGIGAHEETLQQRARVVGWMHALNEKSATLIGQAYLLGLLGNPGLIESWEKLDALERARHDALDDFVKLHRAVYGITTAQSILKNQIATGEGAIRGNPTDNPGAYGRLRRMIRRVRDGAPFIRRAGTAVVPLHVLQRVAADEVVNAAGQPDVNLLSQTELSALRWAADALLDRVERADETDSERTPGGVRRAVRYQPLFDGDRTGIDDEALAAAVERLRGSCRGST